MADIEDLNYTSISDMSQDEAIEMLRQIRLSRRIPSKPRKVSTPKPSKAPPKINADQAAAILKILGESK